MRPCFAHSYAQLNDEKHIGTTSSSSNVVTIPSKYLWTIEVHQLYLELFFIPSQLHLGIFIFLLY